MPLSSARRHHSRSCAGHARDWPRSRSTAAAGRRDTRSRGAAPRTCSSSSRSLRRASSASSVGWRISSCGALGGQRTAAARAAPARGTPAAPPAGRRRAARACGSRTARFTVSASSSRARRAKLRPRRHPAHARQPERAEQPDPQPADVDLPALHREARRARERMMIVVQLLPAEQQRPRQQIGGRRGHLEAAIADRVAEAVDDAAGEERLRGEVHGDHDDAGHAEQQQVRQHEQHQAGVGMCAVEAPLEPVIGRAAPVSCAAAAGRGSRRDTARNPRTAPGAARTAPGCADRRAGRRGRGGSDAPRPTRASPRRS